LTSKEYYSQELRNILAALEEFVGEYIKKICLKLATGYVLEGPGIESRWEIIMWRVSSRPDVFVAMVQKFSGFCDGTSKFRGKTFMFSDYNFEANFLH
jgi:hypothetical protein